MSAAGARVSPGTGWRRALPLLGVLLLGSAGAAARPAEERPRVTLRLDPCLALDAARVERLTAMEIGALGARLAAAPDDDTSDLSVTCTASPAAGAELRVDDPVTGKSLLRIVDLDVARPAARPRLLALALAELLFASWTELEIALQPDPPPQVLLPGGRPLATAAARNAASQALRLRLPAAVRAEARPALQHTDASTLRILGLFAGQGERGTGLLLGGGVRVAGDYPHHLGFSADALVLHGSAGFSSGDVSTDDFCTGAALLLHGRLGRFVLRGGAGGRLAAIRFVGVPRDARLDRGASLIGPSAGPMAVLMAGAALSAHLALDVSLEGGYALLPVAGRIEGQRAVAFDGGWIAAQVGLGWRR